VAAAKERRIPVTFAPGILDETTADGAFALLLAAARRLGEAERFLRAGKYRGWTPFMFTGQDVNHATLGVVGMGRIGRALSRRAKGFAMTILYHDARRNEDAERELEATFIAGLDDLLARSDFVSLHVPLLPETRHLMNAERLRRMKRTGILINTSRGPVVDEKALADALKQGVIAGAGLDVYEREPAVEPALLALENVVPRFAARGVAALAVNLRGYAGSSGKTNRYRPNAPWTPVTDLRAAKAALRGRGASEIALVGASMGGSAVLASSFENDVECVVAVSAPVAGVPEELAKKITGRKLFVCADRDSLRAAPNVLRCFTAASSPKTLVFFGGREHSRAMFTASYGEEAIS